jgi:hypothetical protein
MWLATAGHQRTKLGQLEVRLLVIVAKHQRRKVGYATAAQRHAARSCYTCRCRWCACARA